MCAASMHHSSIRALAHRTQPRLNESSIQKLKLVLSGVGRQYTLFVFGLYWNSEAMCSYLWVLMHVLAAPVYVYHTRKPHALIWQPSENTVCTPYRTIKFKTPHSCKVQDQALSKSCFGLWLKHNSCAKTQTGHVFRNTNAVTNRQTNG